MLIAAILSFIPSLIARYIFVTVGFLWSVLGSFFVFPVCWFALRQLGFLAREGMISISQLCGRHGSGRAPRIGGLSDLSVFHGDRVDGAHQWWATNLMLYAHDCWLEC
jgi:hypothetical protein